MCSGLSYVLFMFRIVLAISFNNKVDRNIADLYLKGCCYFTKIPRSKKLYLYCNCFGISSKEIYSG